MYTSSADENVGLLVGVFRGAVIPEADYARAIASIARSDTNAVRRSLVNTCVLVTDVDAPSPPPIWRQRMAKANNSLVAERYYFALVSPSLMIRGVFTAVTWLTRSRPGHQLAAFPDLAHASVWLEAHTDHTALSIRRLYELALQQTLLGEELRARNTRTG
jgi:hypothetical protein